MPNKLNGYVADCNYGRHFYRRTWTSPVSCTRVATHPLYKAPPPFSQTPILSMPPVLPGEQIADGCVVLVTPLLVLARCATEATQGGRVDDVLQLAPSSLCYGADVLS
nr:unnamed protein product [Spirometra erinaceieuropaei]